MSNLINSANQLRANYMQLERSKKTKFRHKISELFEWNSESTFFRKIREDYKPTPIEVQVSTTLLQELLNQNKNSQN